jgi:hypothetical protein
MERELTYLLADLCANWGWCIPPLSAENISKMPELDAKTFACYVIEAEGLNAEYELKHVRKISNMFRERFGSDQISTSTFVDRVRGHKESWR